MRLSFFSAFLPFLVPPDCRNMFNHKHVSIFLSFSRLNLCRSYAYWPNLCHHNVIMSSCRSLHAFHSLVLSVFLGTWVGLLILYSSTSSIILSSIIIPTVRNIEIDLDCFLFVFIPSIPGGMIDLPSVNLELFNFLRHSYSLFCRAYIYLQV